MSTNVIKFALLGSLLLLIAATAKKELARLPASEIGENMIILGDLGRPIGEEVTIHGYKFRNGPHGDCFHVDSLDGKPFRGPFWIHVKGVGGWLDNTKATLRGNEVGIIGFTHWGDGNGPPDEDGEAKFKPRQTIYLHFEVLDILDPKDLKLVAQ